MRNVALAGVLLLLLLVTPAAAHRLDEYLQASTLAVAKDHVEIEMRLVPGVAVLDTVLPELDPDDDGVIAETEQRTYVQRVLKDISLQIDRQPIALRTLSATFPTVDQINAGLGEIVLKFHGDMPAQSVNHTILFENHHHRAIAAYLMNCLVPSDPGLHITAQNRNYVQSTYALEIAQDAGAPATDAAVSDNGAPSRTSAFQTFFLHGIRHIVTGYDHLLFVSALCLAATSLWDLIKVVSTFTVAHTITLTLAALGWVHAPEYLVELLISASIVFVAVQNVLWPTQAYGWTRLAVAFFFGLFHGLGFAGGLLDVVRNMPPGTMLLALVAFSAGIETGHQMVVLPLFGGLKLIRQARADAISRTKLAIAIQRLGSAGITVVGSYYLLMAVIGRA